MANRIEELIEVAYPGFLIYNNDIQLEENYGKKPLRPVDSTISLFRDEIRLSGI